MSRRLSAEERRALSELNRILSETPQWSGEEELCIEMENIGGRVCFVVKCSVPTAAIV